MTLADMHVLVSATPRSVDLSRLTDHLKREGISNSILTLPGFVSAWLPKWDPMSPTTVSPATFAEMDQSQWDEMLGELVALVNAAMA